MNQRGEPSVASPTVLVVLLTGAVLVATDVWWPPAIVWLIVAMALLWCDQRDPIESNAKPSIERIEGSP